MCVVDFLERVALENILRVLSLFVGMSSSNKRFLYAAISSFVDNVKLYVFFSMQIEFLRDS